jgi:hypothetical protein
MKDYGKRQIPRNPTEFVDLVLPYVNRGESERAVEILRSYSMRKKRHPYKDHETAPLILFMAFLKGYPASIQCVFQSLYVSTEIVLEEFEEEVMSLADEMLKLRFGTVQKFLSTYIASIKLDNYRCDIEIIYHPLHKLQPLVSEYGSFSKTWQYGLKNNRNDICGRFLLNTAAQELLMSATSEVRIRKGLTPKLTKWKNEQLLFDRIKLAFPELVVIGQGSPEWLEGQRFDIWLPQISVAIEYNGAQHFDVVDFFGGEEGHKRTKERDEMKRRKCAENNTTLLEVTEGYNFELLLADIKSKK